MPTSAPETKKFRTSFEGMGPKHDVLRHERASAQRELGEQIAAERESSKEELSEQEKKSIGLINQLFFDNPNYKNKDIEEILPDDINEIDRGLLTEAQVERMMPGVEAFQRDRDQVLQYLEVLNTDRDHINRLREICNALPLYLQRKRIRGSIMPGKLAA